MKIIEEGNVTELTRQKAVALVQQEIVLPRRITTVVAKKVLASIRTEEPITVEQFHAATRKAVGASQYLKSIVSRKTNEAARDKDSASERADIAPDLKLILLSMVVDGAGLIQATTVRPDTTVRAGTVVSLGTRYGPAALRLLAGGVISGFVQFLLGLLVSNLGTRDESGKYWRQVGDELVFDDGPGGGYFGDGTAPAFGQISVRWLDCCEGEEGIRVTISVEVTDDSGDFWENDTGVKKIEATAHSVEDADAGRITSKQIDAKLDPTASENASPGEERVTRFELSGCVPCNFFDDDGNVLITISAEDWNGNARIKKQALTAPSYELARCC